MDALRRSVEAERGGGEDKTERRAAARERSAKKAATVERAAEESQLN